MGPSDVELHREGEDDHALTVSAGAAEKTATHGAVVVAVAPQQKQRRDMAIGKAMSWLLRHAAVRELDCGHRVSPVRGAVQGHSDEVATGLDMLQILRPLEGAEASRLRAWHGTTRRAGYLTSA